MTYWMLQTFALIGLIFSALFAAVVVVGFALTVLVAVRQRRQRRARARYTAEAVAQAEAQLNRPLPVRRVASSEQLWAEIEAWPEMRGRSV